MVYITLSIIQSTLIFVIFKLFNRFRIDNLQAITINYLVACLFGILITGADRLILEAPSYNWFYFAIVLGVFFIVVFNIFALSSQKAGVALTSVASKMSVVIPVILGIILYHEMVNALKITGVITALLAFYLTLKKPGNTGVKYKFFYLLILIFIGNGIVDSLMKYTQHYYVTDNLIQFITMVFFTSFILGGIVLTVKMSITKRSVEFKNILAGIILGLINFGSTYTLFKALSFYESSLVFPVANAGIVGLSTLTGFFIFKEKLTLVNWGGIILSLIAILIIAFA